jgi:chromosome segregation ATPase
MLLQKVKALIVGPSRTELVAQLEALEREAAQRAEALGRELTGADADCQRQHERLVAARRRAGDLRAQRARDSDRLARARNQLQRQLAPLADPQIDGALRRLEMELVEVRARPRRDSIRESDTIRVTSTKRLLRPVSNRPALGRLVDAAVAARQALEALKYRHVDDLPAAIAAIEASLPWAGIDQMEFDGEEFEHHDGDAA